MININQLKTFINPPMAAKPVFFDLPNGEAIDLINPQIEELTLGELAVGLSKIARFNGQTEGEIPYSVAQHSMLVFLLISNTTWSEQKNAQYQIAALLHDAAELITNDIPTPVKRALVALSGNQDNPLQKIETNLTDAFYRRFAPGVPNLTDSDYLKEADAGDLVREWRDLRAAARPRHLFPTTSPYGEVITVMKQKVAAGVYGYLFEQALNILRRKKPSTPNKCETQHDTIPTSTQ
jgi:hypothetical protein